MDVSEKYIEMCEKATEIQEMWQYDDGDFYLHRFTTRNVEEDRFKWMIGKEIVMTMCISCNIRDSYGDQYVSEYNPKGENIWLPRQDQLQEIVFEGETFGSHVATAMFKLLSDYLHRITNPKCEYWHDFESLEQLWLAFTMKERYDKVWNGTEWILQKNI